MPVRISDYPQLAMIAWNRPGDAWLDDAEAFALYERNWRWIEPDKLTTIERGLIERLTREIGKEVLLVGAASSPTYRTTAAPVRSGSSAAY